MLSTDPSSRNMDPPPDAAPLSPISLVELASALLRRRYLILRLALLGALLALGINILRRSTYSSFAAFMPQTSRQSNSLSGIATQFGIALPAADPGQTPPFYVDLVNSGQLLSSLATSEFPDPSKNGAQRPLWAILNAKGETPAARISDAVLLLRRRIRPSVRAKTGVVDVVVTVDDPALAAAMCTRLLELVNRFNLETRQTQAAAEARFVQGRLADAKTELRVAEDRLQIFLQHNREFRASPELTFQEDRLRRDVTLDQQIVATLSQSYEQARIDQVRDTPAITVLERPIPPPAPDPRRHLRHAVIGAFLGLLFGIAWVWTSDFFHALLRRRDTEIEEFHSLVDDSASDLRRPWRMVSRLFFGRPATRA